MNISKDKVTIVIPCYNEADTILNTVLGYQKSGYSNIIVVNDGSRDKTEQQIANQNIKIVSNSRPSGLAMAILRGLYEVETEYALVVYYPEDKLINFKLLDEFIEFGVTGKYSLLLSKDDESRSNRIRTLIKKRFGIFLDNPLFIVGFFDKRLLEIVKEEVSGGRYHIYFEVLKKAIEHKLKIGTYTVGIKGYKRFLTLKHFIDSKKPDSFDNPYYYFKYAVPDLERRDIIKAVLIAVIGFCVIRSIELVFSLLQ